MPVPTPPCTCPTSGTYRFDPDCTLHGMDVLRHCGDLRIYEPLHNRNIIGTEEQWTTTRTTAGAAPA